MPTAPACLRTVHTMMLIGCKDILPVFEGEIIDEHAILFRTMTFNMDDVFPRIGRMHEALFLIDLCRNLGAVGSVSRIDFLTMDLVVEFFIMVYFYTVLFI